MGNLLGGVQRKFLLVYHLFQRLLQLIDAHQTLHTGTAHAQIFTDLLIAALHRRFACQNVRLRTAASLAFQSVHFHLCGAGQFRDGNVLAVEVAIYALDLRVILVHTLD